jgi:hypothetical protein
VRSSAAGRGQQGQVDLLRFEQLHARGDRLRVEDQAIGAFQQAPHAGAQPGLVVDDQDPVGRPLIGADA